MTNQRESGLGWVAFPESAARVDLLVGQALILAADRWDSVSVLIAEAMGIAMLTAARFPASMPTWVPGLNNLNLSECIDAALREVQEWDLYWAHELPDMARLRVVLSDVRHELAVGTTRQA